MKAQELRQKYLDFFVKKGHRIIPSAPLIPGEKVELAGTQRVLFITAGMHPLIPYLLGESHPEGKRLVNVQKCLRTDDIDEVGDKVHHTFFEMLGNWSLGDYWKKEAIEWSFEFLTSKAWLGIPKEKLAISVFAGDEDAPFDQESYDEWKKLGISDSRIAKLPKKNNWWGPVGETGPCGPDTEMFIWASSGKAPENFDPDDPNWFEIWNDVFMEYEKTAEGKFKPLKQKNVDTGMGMERMLAVLNGVDDDYQTELFMPIIQIIEKESGKKYQDHPKEMRIIADHLKAAVFLAQEGLTPGNKDRGYVMRRLIRRAVVQMDKLGPLGILAQKVLPEICQKTIDIYGSGYFNEKSSYTIQTIIGAEIDAFEKIMPTGFKLLQSREVIDGKFIFDLHQTYGLPPEISFEWLNQQGRPIDKEKIEKEFQEEFGKHQELSRQGAEKKFAGGLADESEQVVRYHTATHLLHAALRQILGNHVEQKGSNITTERLRFDFSHPQKMTEEEIKKAEDLVNQKIRENLPVKIEEMTYEEAIKNGALAFFKERYGEKVKVYSIGSFSNEVCGGPHVDWTGKLGMFKIKKEESVSKDTRRIYSVLN